MKYSWQFLDSLTIDELKLLNSNLIKQFKWFPPVKINYNIWMDYTSYSLWKINNYIGTIDQLNIQIKGEICIIFIIYAQSGNNKIF